MSNNLLTHPLVKRTLPNEVVKDLGPAPIGTPRPSVDEMNLEKIKLQKKFYNQRLNGLHFQQEELESEIARLEEHEDRLTNKSKPAQLVPIKKEPVTKQEPLIVIQNPEQFKRPKNSTVLNKPSNISNNITKKSSSKI